MRLGLGTYAFRWSIGHRDVVPDRPMSAIACLDIAEALGLTVVQYADNLPLHTLDREQLAALGASARSRNIVLEIGIQSFDRAMVERYAGIAKLLKARILRVALDAADANTPVSQLSAEISEVLPTVGQAGARLAIENHFDFPSKQMVAVLDRVADERLGVCLDVANSICAGEWPMETLKILAPYTINLHLKDYVIDPDPYGVGFRILGCPLGQGRTDIPATLAALGGSARDMSVILEHWLPLDGDLKSAMANERPWLERSVRHARRFVAETEALD